MIAAVTVVVTGVEWSLVVMVGQGVRCSGHGWAYSQERRSGGSGQGHLG